MTDRPIIFSAPMIRALLDGRKTQTRRVLNQQPVRVFDHEFCPEKWQEPGVYICVGSAVPQGAAFYIRDTYGAMGRKPMPYFTGQRLWVRETWQAHSWASDCVTIRYRAEEKTKGFTDQIEQIKYPNGDKNAFNFVAPQGPYRWRPSIHMPRWASRLTLIVTDVRVQRLQDISAQDAESEGVFRHVAEHSLNKVFRSERGTVAVEYFRDLWNSLHGPDAWDANPWVCAISFTVQRGNIDQLDG